MNQYPRLFAFATASFLVLSATSSFGQKMYWLTQDKIQRADLDGSNVEDLVTNEFGFVFNFALDPRAGKIYWPDGKQIRRANLDGSSNEVVIVMPLFGPQAIALDPQEEKLYWFDFVSDRILRANLDGSGIETIVVLPGMTLIALFVDASGQEIYWVGDSPDVIGRADLGGSNVETLVMGEEESKPLSIAVDSQGGKLYWTDILRDEIRRANIDGSDVEIIVAGIDDVVTIALDTAKGKMYWSATGNSDNSRGKIQRANLDGTDVETVLVGRFVAPFRVSPSVIALDPMMEKMYWLSLSTRIQRADLDGSNVETILRPRLRLPSGLALDLSSNFMYWTDRSALAEFILQRAKLDGSAVEELVAAGAETVTANAVALDRVAKKVYWLQLTGGGSIYRANFDGSDVERLLSGAFFLRGRLAVDAAAGKMYWTDIVGLRNLLTVFHRANLDGTDVEVLLAMELSENIGFDLDLSARKMYWAGGRQVFRSNLDGTAVENLIPREAGLSHLLHGFAVDPVRGRMYWLDRGTEKIQRANLDGSEIEDLVIDVKNLVAIALDLGCGGVDCQANGVGDECESDTDGDGLIDDCDMCPASDVRPNVFVNDCDTGVPNQLLDIGCTMNDRIAACPNQMDRRNDFPRCARGLARSWRSRGLITGRQLGMILRCIGRQGNPGRASDSGVKTEPRN